MNKHSRFRRRRFIPIMIIAALALVGLLVMLLWNALMPAIFALPAISYWQALGLFILSRLLLGGFGGKPGGKMRRHGRRNRRRKMIHHLRERWEHMTPEQREKMHQLWKKRWDIDIEEDMPGQPEE